MPLGRSRRHEFGFPPFGSGRALDEPKRAKSPKANGAPLMPPSPCSPKASPPSPEAPGRSRQAGAGRFGMRPRPSGRMQSGVRCRRVRDSFLSGNTVTENKTSTLSASAAHHRRSRRKSPPGARGRHGNRFMVGAGGQRPIMWVF